MISLRVSFCMNRTLRNGADAQRSRRPHISDKQRLSHEPQFARHSTSTLSASDGMNSHQHPQCSPLLRIKCIEKKRQFLGWEPGWKAALLLKWGVVSTSACIPRLPRSPGSITKSILQQADGSGYRILTLFFQQPQTISALIPAGTATAIWFSDGGILRIENSRFDPSLPWFLNSSQRRIFQRSTPARPSRPLPIRSKPPGSGTGLVGVPMSKSTS